MADSGDSVAVLHFRWAHGDRVAGSLLYSLAFNRMRGIASALLSRQRFIRTLQPTALIHECFLKFHRSQPYVNDDEHFFYVATRAMREALVDYSRRGQAQKRSPQSLPEELRTVLWQNPEADLTIRAAFEKLQRFDRRVADNVWLRSVEGATIGEVSDALGIELWRAREEYDFGLLWLSEELAGAPLK